MNPGRLHILTDSRLQQRYGPVELAMMAFAGGADVVQYREKLKPEDQMRNEIEQMMRVPRNTQQRLIVNDHVNLALHAQGVHVGIEDMDPVEARKVLGPAALMGATVHTMDELARLVGAPIDYIGVGPVFGTTSKATGLPPLGLDGLERLCALSPWPVIAIGNISLERTRDVISAGAHGVAILSAFCLHPEPTAIAEAFAEILA